MFENIKCMFVEDFSGEEGEKLLELEHHRLRSVFNLTGNLLVGMLIFGLFYITAVPVSNMEIGFIFGVWSLVFLGYLMAFEKMFKDIESQLE